MIETDRDRGSVGRGRVVLGVAWLPALAAFAWLVHRFWWTGDDAFISFRYARNLVRGDGLVFNPALETPVEGYTNFLWTLYLAAWEAVGADLPTVANLTSAACGAWLIVMVVRFVRARLGADTLRDTSVGLFVATLPPIAIWATSGLETMPFALCVFATFDALARDPERPRGVRAGAWAIAAALVRADGALWVAAVFCASLVPIRTCAKSPRLRAVLVAGGLVTVAVAAHLLWRHGTYGEWLPNTAKIKLAAADVRQERGLNYVVSLLLCVPSLIVVALVATATSLRALRVGATGSAAPLALPAALVCSFGVAYAVRTGGDFMAMGRFLVPALPFVALLFAACLARLASRGAALALSGVVLALGVAANFDAIPVPDDLRQRFHFRWNRPRARSEIAQWEFMRDNEQLLHVLARALALHTTEGESLIRSSIGVVGYRTELTLFDRYGLVSPEILATARPRERASPGHDVSAKRAFFLPQQPTYLIAQLTPSRNPPRAGLPADVLELLDERDDLELVRHPLRTRDGFPKGFELRLVRLNSR